MPMVVQYSLQDISRVFGRNIVLKLQRLIADGLVTIRVDGNKIFGEVEDEGAVLICYVVPTLIKNKIEFPDHDCSCRRQYCKHVAAIAFLALDQGFREKPEDPGAIGHVAPRGPRKLKRPPAPNARPVDSSNPVKENNPAKENKIGDDEHNARTPDSAAERRSWRYTIVSWLLSGINRLFHR